MPPRVRRAGVPRVYAGGWVEVGEYRRRLSVTLDGSGNGQVQFDVRSSNQRYKIRWVTVTTNQSPNTAPYPNVTIYEGTAQAGLSDGATWTGNQDTLSGQFIIDACTDMIAQFVGGVPGSIGTVTIEGVNELPAALAEIYGENIS